MNKLKFMVVDWITRIIIAIIVPIIVTSIVFQKSPIHIAEGLLGLLSGQQ